MGSLLKKLRNISEQEVKPILTQEDKKDFPPLVWRATSKSIQVIRTYILEDKYYFVFFIHTPTIFKTRGRYVTVEREDKEKFKLMLQMSGFTFNNFNINERGDISTSEEVPFLNLNNQQSFLELQEADNSKDLQVDDLLDLLDFLMFMDGDIHMNPFKEVPKLTNRREINSKFELGRLQDYRRKVYEFVTSQEKSTLSYRYMIKGYEMEDGIEVEKFKFFQYPLLDNKGRVGVDEIEITVPRSEENEYYIDKYLGHLIKPGTVGVYKGNEIYFIVDTSKLKPIRTLHEILISKQLVANREKCRLLLRSISSFKSSLKNMALRAGVPIWEDNMYTYGATEKIEDDEVAVMHKVVYTSRDTKLGNIKFKDLLDKSGVKSMEYIENLISQYLEGKLDMDFLERHIINADKVFKSQSLNEALKILFTSIKGKNLKEMFSAAQKTYIALERLNNSLKIRLHIFKESEGEMEDFLTRAVASLPKNTDFRNEDYLLLEYEVENNLEKDNFIIEIKTEIKY